MRSRAWPSQAQPQEIHFPKRRAEVSGEGHGVAVCAVRGAEAGHRHGEDLRPRKAQQIEGPGRHQQRQRRIQSAGNADHRRLRVGVRQPFLEPHRLNHQDLLAAAVAVLLRGGHERMRIKGTDQSRLAELNLKRNHRIRLRFPDILRRERGHPPALGDEAVHIEIRADRLVGEQLRLSQQRAVLRDHVLSAEDEVRRGLPFARRRVDVAADAASRVAFDERPAVAVLAHQLVRRGEVHDDGGAGADMADGGRTRHPEVLAYLRSDDQPRHRRRLKQQTGSQRYLTAGRPHRYGPFRRRLEIPRLIELIVGRQIRFRDEAEDPAVAKRRGAVVQLAARLHRQSDEQQRVHVRGMLRENRELLHRRAQQLRLPEQVAALVPREAKLRKHDYLRVRFLQLADPPLDLHSVGNAVRNRHRRGHRRDAHKSVFHAVLLTVSVLLLT